MSKFSFKKNLDKQSLTDSLHNNDVSLLSLAEYELVTTFFGGLVRVLGCPAASFLSPSFKKAGRGIILGQDLTVRHSWNISIGDQAMLCLLPVVPEIKE